MKTRIIALLSGIALLFGVGVVGATSASANVTPGNYGKIQNAFTSDTSITIRDAAGRGQILWQGQISTEYGMQDVESFYVPYGCYAKIGSQPYTGGLWYSLSNNYNVRLIVVTC